MKPLTIIKIGGNVIDNSENLHRFLLDFTALPGDKILVHGGGKIATELSESLGIEAKMVDGRRITDIETLRIVTMVYAGLINKNMVAPASGCCFWLIILPFPICAFAEKIVTIKRGNKIIIRIMLLFYNTNIKSN